MEKAKKVWEVDVTVIRQKMLAGDISNPSQIGQSLLNGQKALLTGKPGNGDGPGVLVGETTAAQIGTKILGHIWDIQRATGSMPQRVTVEVTRDAQVRIALAGVTQG